MNFINWLRKKKNSALVQRVESLEASEDSQKSVNSIFCVMPWSNLATETDGKCKMCCIVMTNKYIQTDDGEDAKIHKHSLNQIWNSRYVRKLRQQMLRGEWPDDCWYCKRQEVQKLDSPRQEYNKLWMSRNILKRVEESRAHDGWVSAPPSSLEPRPGILCNLKCTMCWSMSSSKIFSERKAFVESQGEGLPYLKSAWKYEVEEASSADFTWADQEQYIKNFEACAPHLKRLYFTGGEPFLIKSNFDRLQHLIDIKHTDLTVSLTTNLAVWNQKYIDVLSQFKRVELTVSIDAYGLVNSYVRNPSVWETIEQNFLRYLKEYPQFYPSIICTVQNLTVFGVLDLLCWLSALKTPRPVNFIITELQGPSCMQPRVLPPTVKARFRERAMLLQKDESLQSVYRDKIQALLQWVDTPCEDYQERAGELREFIEFYHQKNKIKLVDIFPELHAELYPSGWSALTRAEPEKDVASHL